MSEGQPLLEVRDLQRLFPVRRTAGEVLGRRQRHVHAVDTVSFSLGPGEILALVGESGCGKSTTGRLLVRLDDATGGEIVFEGEQVRELSGDALKRFRRRAQIIAQNPFEAFDPRMTVGASLEQGLRIHRLGTPGERRAAVLEGLSRIGLEPAADFAQRYPHELSGGQLQRIATLRATLLQPRFLVADEPVSMLDVSVRADILNQFLDLRDEQGMAIVLITHDIAVARYVAGRIAVMYLGMFVETGTSSEVIDEPKHPYTRALLSHTLSIGDDLPKVEPVAITGDPPTPVDLKPGCRFANRCPFAFDRCVRETPPLLQTDGTRRVACHLYDGHPEPKQRET